MQMVSIRLLLENRSVLEYRLGMKRLGYDYLIGLLKICLL